MALTGTPTALPANTSITLRVTTDAVPCEPRRLGAGIGYTVVRMRGGGMVFSSGTTRQNKRERLLGIVLSLVLVFTLPAIPLRAAVADAAPASKLVAIVLPQADEFGGVSVCDPGLAGTATIADAGIGWFLPAAAEAFSNLDSQPAFAYRSLSARSSKSLLDAGGFGFLAVLAMLAAEALSSLASVSRQCFKCSRLVKARGCRSP